MSATLIAAASVTAIDTASTAAAAILWVRLITYIACIRR
jgi:hypothetical protein